MMLVVDDEPEMREYLAALLESAGHAPVEVAGDAEEAFRLLGMTGGGPRRAPSLILMDIVMPGIEATCRIKADPELADVPVVMVTGVEDSEGLEAAFVAGAADYVVKPVRDVPLLTRVRAVLNLRLEALRRRAREEELERANAELSRSGARALPPADPATGLPDRAALEEALRVRAAVGQASTTFLLAVGLDGHENRRRRDAAAAEEALRLAAGALAAAPGRIGDLAAACGRGRIVVALDRADAEEAAHLAEAVHAAVAAALARLPPDPMAEPATASCVLVRAAAPEPVAHALERLGAAMAEGGGTLAADPREGGP
jgi:CheY-like chemotaxis protein